MPKSKRDRKISLTVTKKKGLEFKQNFITEVREALDTYENMFVISMFNQRNIFLKDLRRDFSTDSKFLFGKNKLISLALGRNAESEYLESIHKVTPYLIGNIGLLFSNRSKEEVIEFFNTFSHPDYARSGNIAQEDAKIEVGPLEQFQHTMEPQLRKLGLHTSLKKGVVHLDVEHQICKKSDKLTPEQARLLKLFGHMQAEFKVKVKMVYNKPGQLFELLDSSVDDEGYAESESAEEEMEEDEENLQPVAKKIKGKKAAASKTDVNNN